MLKKTFTTLASSILLASNTQAIPFQPGDNMVVGFNTFGMGSFLYDTGVSADDFVTGTGFSLDISAAFSALGGSIESFMILGRTTPYATTVYNYDEYAYVDPGAGLVYAQTVPEPLRTNSQLQFATFNTAATIANASFGWNGEGTFGDLDNRAPIVFGLGNGFLNSFSDLLGSRPNTRHFHQYQTTGVSTAQNEQTVFTPSVVDELWCTEGEGATFYESVDECLVFVTASYNHHISLSNNILTVQGFQGAAVIPIPGAAWLFLSACSSLIMIKRKGSSHITTENQ